MRSRGAMLMLAMLTLLPAAVFAADLGAVRMSLVQGDVQILTEDTREWVPAAVNTPLGEGDRLWNPADGRSELQIMGGAYIRLDYDTAFDIIALDKTSSRFYLPLGRAYSNNRGSGVGHLQIDTPLSTVSCYADSVVMVDVTESGATDIAVLQGEAFAETRAGKTRIPAGNVLRIAEDLTARFVRVTEADDWEAWNHDLDRRLDSAGYSAQYLPPELADYGHDFSTYGRWLYNSSYGYVWTPTLAITVNWSPYRTGKWVWIGGNYVWVSYEPWGWAPYHYGRWTHVNRVGWCWVPPRRGAVHWGPGYVGWVHTPTYVSWVPLAPGDLYYGHGSYGPNSVNLITSSANMADRHRNFRNLRVPNAVITQHRDSFIRNRKVDVTYQGNPFLERNVGIGPPRFKPEPATVAPVMKNIPRSKLPPQRLQQLQPELLKRERQQMRDPRGSSFNPGTPARTMPVITREAPQRTIRVPASRAITGQPQKKVIPERGVTTQPGTTATPPRKPDTMQPRVNRERQSIPAQPVVQPPVRRTPQPVVTPSAPARIQPTPSRQPAPAADKPRRQEPIRTAPQPIAQQPVAPQPVVKQPSVTPQPAAPRTTAPVGDAKIRQRDVRPSRQQRDSVESTVQPTQRVTAPAATGRPKPEPQPRQDVAPTRTPAESRQNIERKPAGRSDATQQEQPAEGTAQPAQESRRQPRSIRLPEHANP